MGEFLGKRVLVVEDEALIAMSLEAMLEGLGCVVLGPVSSLEKGLENARSLEFDVAILDVNLRGARSDPIAEELSGKGTPFILATGYGAEFAKASVFPVLEKPYHQEQLARALRKVFSAALSTR